MTKNERNQCIALTPELRSCEKMGEDVTPIITTI